MIRDVLPNDNEAIATLYNYYILNTAATFEEQPITGLDIAQRIDKSLAANLPWIVLVIDHQLIGYAYATKWKDRSAYRHSVEVSVYLAHESLGKGYGTRLYKSLFDRLGTLGINAVVGGITLPNEASVALHEKLGMQKVAHFPNIGFKFGKWLDVGYWQLNLHEPTQASGA